MPKRRPPREIWNEIRRKVWERDGKRCVRPDCRSLTLEECHIDHIQSGKLATNALSNLRTLCRYHHVLRADNRHRGMIASALRDGIIPADWRPLIWSDEDLPKD